MNRFASDVRHPRPYLSLLGHLREWFLDVAYDLLDLDRRIQIVVESEIGWRMPAVDACAPPTSSRVSSTLHACPASPTAAAYTPPVAGCVEDFLLACCVDDPTAVTQFADLHGAYRHWCRASTNLVPLSRPAFGQCLTAFGYRCTRAHLSGMNGTGHVRLGVRLRTAATTAATSTSKSEGV